MSYLFLSAFLIHLHNFSSQQKHNFRQGADTPVVLLVSIHQMGCTGTAVQIFSAKSFPAVGLDVSACGTMMEMAPKLSELQKTPHTPETKSLSCCAVVHCRVQYCTAVWERQKEVYGDLSLYMQLCMKM